MNTFPPLEVARKVCVAEDRIEMTILVKPFPLIRQWLPLVLALSWAASAQAAQPLEKADYRIGPGDVLQVIVWKESDLTREVTVRTDGKITLPLLGDVESAGRAPQQLAADIAAGLARFIESPQVAVGVAQPNSRKIFVVGQVARAGAFPLIGPTTFLQALALAGGFQQFAKSDKVIVVRQTASGQTLVRVDYKKIESGTDVEGQDVFLEPGDTIVVP
jgi:polysaccharide biosynthesis/export protein